MDPAPHVKLNFLYPRMQDVLQWALDLPGLALVSSLLDCELNQIFFTLKRVNVPATIEKTLKSFN